MPIHIASAYFSRLLALDALPVILSSVAAASFLRAWSAGVDLISALDRAAVQSEKEAEPGQKPSIRPRDLHGTVTIVVGGFTSQGLLTCAQLSSLGSQLILLTPSIQSDRIIQLVHLLRDGTSNPLIFAEECDVTSIASIEAFAAQWNLGEASGGSNASTMLMDGGDASSKTSGQSSKPAVGPRRVDSLIFLPLDDTRSGIRKPAQTTSEGVEAAFAELLGRFHLVNLLLPSLFLLPPNRDIRIVSLLSPWYAAGRSDLNGTEGAIKRTNSIKASPWTKDGRYALLWYALSRELQRRIQLLTEADQRPRTKLPGIDDEGRIRGKATPTNVNLINVCAGFERGRDVLDYLWPFAETHSNAIAEGIDDEKSVVNKDSQGEELRALIDPRLRQRKKAKQNTRDPVKSGDGKGMMQLKTNAQTKSMLALPLDMLQTIMVILLWPIAWLLCKSPRRVAESVTWATIAPVRTDEVFNAALNATAVVPAEMHREGKIIRPALPDSLLPGPAMQAVWRELESTAKAIVADGHAHGSPSSTM